MSTIVKNRKYFMSSSAERLGRRCDQLATLLFIRSPIILIITLEQVTSVPTIPTAPETA